MTDSVKARAVEYATKYRTRAGIFARIPTASNGVYAAGVPVYTFAPSDEQDIHPAEAIGANWTCVAMVYPL